MRDVQKGRKSWLERLTSPPESEADEAMVSQQHPFERSHDAPPPGDSPVPEGLEAFAPPGLRPPPSDDLRSAPPAEHRERPAEHRERPAEHRERSAEQLGRGFDTGQHPFAPERLHLDPDSGHYAPHDRPHGDPDSGQFSPNRGRVDVRAGDTPPPLRAPAPTPPPPRPRDIWDTPVTPLRTDDSFADDNPRLGAPSPPPSSLAWQTDTPGPPLGLSAPLGDHQISDQGYLDREPESRSDDDTLSRPSEAEQLEDARKRHVDELQHRWLVTQAQILDDPRDAVREAGLLIGDAMQFVTSTFTDHRDRIEREWKHNDSMSTDELRTVMRRYRNLFQYVLSASQLPDL